MRQLSLVLALLLWASRAFAAAPWETALPLAADPGAVVAAAKGVDKGADETADVVFEGWDVSFGEDGTRTVDVHRVVRVLGAAGARQAGAIRQVWSPTSDDRPELRARVIEASGAVHELDPSTVTEAAADDEDDELYDDARVLHAPLPALSSAAVIETWTRLHEHKPAVDAGYAATIFAWDWLPLHAVRIRLSAPVGVPLRHSGLSMKATQTTEGGRVVVVYTGGPFEREKKPEYAQPPGSSQVPRVSYSTGRSWADVAAAYARAVDARLADAGNVAARAKEWAGGAKGLDALEPLLAGLEGTVRYTGVEMGDGGTVPRSPRETLERGFGDCKDLATLYVALLRAVGLKAEVALVSMHEPGAQEALPGLGVFNHAVVCVRATPDQYIDPTNRARRADEAAPPLAGRLVLVAAAGTKALVRLPALTQAQSHETTVREVTLAHGLGGRLVETRTVSGSFSASFRPSSPTTDEALRKEQAGYAKNAFGSEKVERVTPMAPGDRAAPATWSLAAADAKHLAWTNDDGATVTLRSLGVLLDWLPAALRTSLEEEAPEPRRTPLWVAAPHVTELVHHVAPLPGMRLKDLPAALEERWGLATYTRTAKALADGSVEVRDRFDSGPALWQAKDVEEFRAKTAEYLKQPLGQVVFERIARALLGEGRLREAIEEQRRLMAAEPKVADHRRIMALLLAEAGLFDDATAAARKAVELAPDDALTYRMLGWALLRDPFGRVHLEGSDEAGALAAFKKAKELEPKDETDRHNYALELEYGSGHEFHGPDARLAEAADEYRYLRKELKSLEYVAGELGVLEALGRWDDVREVVKSLNAPTYEQRALAVTGLALAKGADAAIAEASRMGASGDERLQVLAVAAAKLSLRREYAKAAQVATAAARGSARAAALASWATELGKLHRHESVPAPTPMHALVRELMVRAMRGDGSEDALTTEHARKVKAELPQALRPKADAVAAALKKIAPAQRNLFDLVLDYSLVADHLDVVGDEATGFRATVRVPPGQQLQAPFFVVREGGELRVAASGKAHDELGWNALRLLEGGQVDAARRWLDWALETGEQFQLDMLWKGIADSERLKPEAIRDAALSMMVRTKDPRVDPWLEEIRQRWPEERRWLAQSLTRERDVQLERWERVLVDCDRYLKGPPAREHLPAFVLVTRLRALDALGRKAEMRTVALAAAAAQPNEVDVAEVAANFLLAQDDFEGVERVGRPLVQAGRASAQLLNTLAWAAVVAGHVTDLTLSDAQASTEKAARRPTLHTLACVHAERGELAEARQVHLRGFQTAPGAEPFTADWYVVGRIAEQLGFPDTARRAYGKMLESQGEEGQRLAKRRMDALGKAE